MKITRTSIADVLIIEPTVFSDDRGWFMESFNEEHFNSRLSALGLPVPNTFVQDNHSKSVKRVLRGLHYQLPPYTQGKLVRCIVGEVFDVAIDLRKKSPTYRKWFGVNLSAENKRQLWIPEGFAHGFLTLTDTAELLYKATNYYAPSHERSILWSDNDLGIDWPSVGETIISNKDKLALKLTDAEVFL